MDKVTRLTAEQEAVRNLPIEGRYVVTGPPGTGKSLLAVLRASKILASKKPVIVLSKNVPLNCHLKESIAPALVDIDSTVNFAAEAGRSIRTYDSWAYGLWRRVPLVAGKTYGEGKGPMLPEDPKWGYDWIRAGDDILERMSPDDARAKLQIPANVLVDEGQDLPAAFFGFLMRMGCDVTVFADENQRIYTGMSTTEKIKEALMVTKSKGSVYEVKKNFRNTRQVAEVAARFYVGLPTGIPDLPDKLGPKVAAVDFNDLEHVADAIIGLAERKRGTAAGTGPSVGVIVLDAKKRLRELHTVLEQRSNGIEVRRYERDDFKDRPFTFDEPETVTLVNPWTMKGLEWDHVVVVLDGFRLKDAPEELLVQKMQSYVAASRPRSRLLLAWTRNGGKSAGGAAPELVRDLLMSPFAEKIERKWTDGN